MSATKLEKFLLTAEGERDSVNYKNDFYLWKRSAAAALETSEKNLERKAQAGKIAQIEQDRKTYYKVSDLLEFEKERGNTFIKPMIDRQPQTNEMALAIPNQFAGMFEMLFNKIESMQPQNSGLSVLTGKRRIDADDFAESLGMLKSKVKAAIKAAEDKGTLKRYAGLRGKAVYNCDDLDIIAAQLLADDKPIEIRKPNFENKAKKKAAKV
jgi:hypothetical protein